MLSLQQLNIEIFQISIAKHTVTGLPSRSSDQCISLIRLRRPQEIYAAMVSPRKVIQQLQFLTMLQIIQISFVCIVFQVLEKRSLFACQCTSTKRTVQRIVAEPPNILFYISPGIRPRIPLT